MLFFEIRRKFLSFLYVKFKSILGYDYKMCKIRYEIKEKVYTGMTLSLFINSDLFKFILL